MLETDAGYLRLITEAAVPGAVAAVIRNGAIDRYVRAGTSGAYSAVAVDENTIFEAASLSKPIFAHTVLQLVDHGFISLDVPLDNYFPGYLPGDPRSALITARHVLSHCAGLPNWRNAEFPLRTYFEPGVEFSYSGEGYLFLQKAVES